MKELIERIQAEGQAVSSEVLKVDSFLNHQIDPKLAQEMGKAFATYFKAKQITKILTVEASGIAPAVFTGLELEVPVIFARKHKSLTLTDNLYTSDVYSYTKEVFNTIAVGKQFIESADKVLIIDDFLANGQAVKGLMNICMQAEAEVVGAGIVIEKSWQNGRKMLEEQGVDIYSLARIKKLAEGQIDFLE